MVSLLDRIKATKAAEEKPQDISLRGMGVTKRIAERDAKAYAREVEKATKTDDSLLKTDAEIKFERAMHETIESLKQKQIGAELVFDDSQLRAIAGILQNRFSVLIGAAGTGKTTIENVLIEELAKRINVIDLRAAKFVNVQDEITGKSVRVSAMETGAPIIAPAIALCAYTGRASQQMKRAIAPQWHRSTSTIHALLGYAPTFEDRMKDGEWKETLVFRPTFGKHCKLPYTVIFMDEAGMTPIPLWNELMDALHKNVRIVLIGDINQLPPVYGKSILGYAMRKWPVFELTTIHRQAAGNAIIMNAHRCLRGQPLQNAQNFHIIGDGVGSKQIAPAGMSGMQQFSLKIIKFFAEKGIFDPYRDAIITPWNKNLIGTVALNTHLVQMFNPERKEGNVIVNKRVKIHTGNDHRYFALGDKVMITANINTVEPPITNGMIGFVDSINVNGKYDQSRSQADLEESEDIDTGEMLDIDMDSLNFKLVMDEAAKDKKDDSEDQRQSSHVMLIKFENGQQYSASTAGDYRKVELGYAITCHKAQGGEYPNVVILCHSATSKSLSREWLYTAITRARQNVYIIGNAQGIRGALKNQRIKGQTIAEKIQSYVIESGSDDAFEDGDTSKHPILWEPQQFLDVGEKAEETVNF